MSYSKYADLPGIAHDEPDVYETTDLPESEQTSDFYEEESEAVEKILISPTDAFNKYKNKQLSSSRVDFSDRITRHKNTGYDFELVGLGEKETPLQKYQRLQCEMNELLEEVNMIKEKKDAQVDCLVTTEQVEAALKKLVDYRLEESLGADVVSSITDPQGTQIKKLISQLERFKASASESPESESSEGDLTGITFQLNYRPEQMRFRQTQRLSELESRLHRLETILGASNEKLSRLSTITSKGSLLEAAQHLSATASMLDSAQLDHIEGRLTALSQKMDVLVEKKKQLSKHAEDNQKIEELYNLTKNFEDISNVLPQTIERMKVLEALHLKAANFAKTLTQLETMQAQVAANVENNETLLKGVQDSFANNLNEINTTVMSLDARIKQFKKK